MSDLHSNTVAFVAGSQIPPSPPPAKDRGAVKWLRDNMFSSVANGILTVIAALVIITAVPAILQWAFIDAVWSAGSLSECREIAAANGVEGAFACWAVINERFNQFLFGFYPNELLWRPVLAFVLMFVAMAPVLFRSLPRQMLWFSLAYPFLAYFLIWGGLGLEPVESSKIGGFLLALIIGVTGIVASLPFGVLLALGRKSDLFFIKTICVVFIEFIRGVPLITLLFVAAVMLSYFVPPGTNFDLLVRMLIMVTLFASGYMAEVIRGGLQAIPKGQYEAADAMGLKYWQAMRLIILPQALKISIPGIVNTFIALYKDTTLVIVIGRLDILGIGNSSLADAKWQGLSTEVYVFVAVFFFCSCFLMSRYSLYLEKKLHTGH